MPNVLQGSGYASVNLYWNRWVSVISGKAGRGSVAAGFVVILQSDYTEKREKSNAFFGASREEFRNPGIILEHRTRTGHVGTSGGKVWLKDD